MKFKKDFSESALDDLQYSWIQNKRCQKSNCKQEHKRWHDGDRLDMIYAIRVHVKRNNLTFLCKST